MSPEKQNIAIAEAVGYRYFRSKSAGIYTFSIGLTGDWEPVESLPDGWEAGGNFVSRNIRRYTDCLNAMHEAEKHRGWHEPEMSGPRWEEAEQYRIHLSAIRKHDQRTSFATASQRAEAFLRTIGKWEDAP